MQDQPSGSNYEPEPPRLSTTPDDFIWDPERQGWYAPGEPSLWDAEAWCREFEEARRRGEYSGGLISRDELLAAGALNVPPSGRKSLSAGVKREHLPLFPDDDTAPTKQESTPCDPDSDLSEDEAP